MMLDDEAKQILIGNDRGGYTIPSDGLYPFQWNWDSCFSALGWACFDEPRAWQEIELLFASQWPDGMIPHIIFHQQSDSYFPGPDVWQAPLGLATSGITQPPVAATALRFIYEKTRNKAAAKDRLAALVPKLFKYHHWFHYRRDPATTGLVAIHHPWESGRDNSPDWDMSLLNVQVQGLEPYRRRDLDHVDAAHRPSDSEYDRYMALVQLFRSQQYDHDRMGSVLPFKVADLGINMILLRANRDLLWLMDLVGDDVGYHGIQDWIGRQETALERLWDEQAGAYRSLDLVSGQHINAVTSANFLAFFAGPVREDRAKTLLGRLEAWSKIATYLVPSLDPEDQRFDSRRYWRGPVWAIINFMIARGLMENGYPGWADRIARDTAALIRESGFMEYFDPLTGKGLGGSKFSWTAAMWLVWAGGYADP